MDTWTSTDNPACAAPFQGGLVTEVPTAARVLGIPDEDLIRELSDGSTIAQVAARRGVDVHRVVVALVSDTVAEVAADVRNGELSTGHVRWLVALATWRAEELVATRFPPISFHQRAGPSLA